MAQQRTYIFGSTPEKVIIPDIPFLTRNPEWDDAANKELNTYRAYNPVALMVEPIYHGGEQSKKEDEYVAEEIRWMPFSNAKGTQFRGRHSLFNAVNAVGDNLNYQVNLNVPLLDYPEIRETIRRKSDCSIKALVDASTRGEMGRAIYTYADFMYCKHLGRISNNYLITLRRFPQPPGDHINYTMDVEKDTPASGHLPDIGRLVTWLGTPGNDMASILKYDVNLPYKDMKGTIQDIQGKGDTTGGFLGGLFNLGSDSYRNAMLSGQAGESGLHAITTMAGPFAGVIGSIMATPEDTSWIHHKDSQKTWGPVDVITQTHYRQGAEDGGIKFEHNITLTFDYELRSYNGINTRAAMLDLLANILAVTFTNASYWGGAVRSTGAAQSNIFSNLPIFHMGEPLTFAKMQDAAFDSLSSLGKTFNNGQPIKGVKDVISALGNLAKGALTAITSGVLNKLGRPTKNALNSMINFQPTGMWHLMIGNPRHPIMSMGNMILDNCSIEHYGPLGLDDFPTGLKVTITLKHGMPRDNLKIEQMYMAGDFRIYQPLNHMVYEDWLHATEIGPNNTGTTNSLATTASTADKPTNTSSDTQTTEAAAALTKSQEKIFMKYFGTTNKNNIIIAGREGYLGANNSGKNVTGKIH